MSSLWDQIHFHFKIQLFWNCTCVFSCLFILRTGGDKILLCCLDCGYFVKSTPLTALHSWLFWNFADSCYKVWKCASGFARFLNEFILLFSCSDLVKFYPEKRWSTTDSWYFVKSTPPTALYWLLWNFAVIFYKDLKIRYTMWFLYTL